MYIYTKKVLFLMNIFSHFAILGVYDVPYCIFCCINNIILFIFVLYIQKTENALNNKKSYILKSNVYTIR